MGYPRAHFGVLRVPRPEGKMLLTLRGIQLTKMSSPFVRLRDHDLVTHANRDGLVRLDAVLQRQEPVSSKDWKMLVARIDPPVALQRLQQASRASLGGPASGEVDVNARTPGAVGRECDPDPARIVAVAATDGDFSPVIFNPGVFRPVDHDVRPELLHIDISVYPRLCIQM